MKGVFRAINGFSGYSRYGYNLIMVIIMTEPTPPKKKKSAGPVMLLAGVILITLGAFLAKKDHKVDTTTGQPVATAPAPETPATPDAAATTTTPPATDATTATPAPAATETVAEKPAPVTYTPVMQAEGRAIGKKDAPIQIKEFASLTCGHCAHFHNDVLDEFRVKYVDTGLVRIQFEAFPLNKPAVDATKILNCLPDSQYYSFMAMLFQTQEHWAFSSDYMTPLRQNAKLAGLSDEKIDACLNDKVAEEKIVTTMQENAKKYSIDSTPSFVINDGQAKVRGAVPVSEFAKVIDPLLSGKTAAPDAAPATTEPAPEAAPAQ